eukprot:1151977-Amphidinium_carterae.1
MATLAARCTASPPCRRFPKVRCPPRKHESPVLCLPAFCTAKAPFDECAGIRRLGLRGVLHRESCPY